MPHCNRVTPKGDIIATTMRGALTGNRGIIHNCETKKLHPTRRWSSKAWIYCLCDFKGRKRDVMGANGPNGSAGWTNLFFFDEATALSAGHRPCFYCQRERAKEFQLAFSAGQDASKMSAPQMDSILHAERLEGREKRLHAMRDDLPDGAMVADDSGALVVIGGALLRWRPDGYSVAEGTKATALLTPPSIVAAMREGFKPSLHKTARAR